jgi:LmbE family N-acetylglucosaminyl deacetylase
MRFFYKNVLVLSPHTDDVEFGAGGTVHKLIQSGSKVTYIAFSICEESLPESFPKDILDKEVRLSTAKLGVKSEDVITLRYKVRKFSYVRQEILEDLVKFRKDNGPFDLVMVPSIHDIHQDHEVISQEGIRAFKNTTLLGYELGWNIIHFDTQCFSQLEATDLNAKIAAIQEYKSQGHRKYSDPDIIKSLAKVRGLQAGCDYAEAFEVIRLFM